MTVGAGVRRGRAVTAFSYAVPIGLLGGLIGLGGAEFRLPVLAGPLGYPARQAVPLNLAVSLVTLAAALGARGSTLSLAAVVPLGVEILALTAGAVVAASFGVGLARRLSDRRLHQVILVLLIAIGLALIAEGVLPGEIDALVPAGTRSRVVAGLLCGLVIGLVSSLLGVAGGELIIPTLVFAFGVDIKTAGTASLMISLPTVLVGIVRYAGHGAFHDRRALLEAVAPMGVGSVIGAVAGGIFVGLVPAAALKVLLGAVLLVSALRIFYRR